MLEGSSEKACDAGLSPFREPLSEGSRRMPYATGPGRG